MDSEYKEGSEYVLSQFIKEGSYGEVHSAQDVNTGFKFAVKKVTYCHLSFFPPPGFKVYYDCSLLCSILLSQIPLKRFSSEEVGAWSALRSPRVVELFGVVREGPNVVLFMDHKSGKQASLLPFRHTHTHTHTHTHSTFCQYSLLLWRLRVRLEIVG